jgi:hypothetical protein
MIEPIRKQGTISALDNASSLPAQTMRPTIIAR